MQAVADINLLDDIDGSDGCVAVVRPGRTQLYRWLPRPPIIGVVKVGVGNPTLSVQALHSFICDSWHSHGVARQLLQAKHNALAVASSNC